MITVTNIGARVSDNGNPPAIVLLSAVPQGSLIIAAAMTDVATEGLPRDIAGNTYNDLVPARLPNENGVLAVFYSYNSIALPSGSAITFSGTGRNTAVSAFYATGAGQQIGVITTQGFASGTGGNPAAVLEADPFTDGCLIAGFVGTAGPVSDAFSQDAMFAAPPIRVGTNSGSATKNRTLAGGSLVESSRAMLAYQPTCRPRDWAAVIGAFLPA